MRRNRMFALMPVVMMASAFALAPSSAVGQKWYEKAVKSITAAFTPEKAKPGQTVTFTLTVELNPGYHTYPTVQPDKNAAAMVNDIKFPDPNAVIFVGELQEPAKPKTKAELELGISEMHYYEGKLTYTRTAVVSPKAKPGKAAVKLARFKLSVCDDTNCFPPKNVPVEATLTVLDGPPMPVEKQYAEEVAKALGK